LNRELLEESEIEGKISKLKFIIEYFIYLGLKRIAINFHSHKSKEILATLKQVLLRIFRLRNISRRESLL
jgi:hypothetical protein